MASQPTFWEGLGNGITFGAWNPYEERLAREEQAQRDYAAPSRYDPYRPPSYSNMLKQAQQFYLPATDEYIEMAKAATAAAPGTMESVMSMFNPMVGMQTYQQMMAPQQEQQAASQQIVNQLMEQAYAENENPEDAYRAYMEEIAPKASSMYGNYITELARQRLRGGM